MTYVTCYIFYIHLLRTFVKTDVQRICKDHVRSLRLRKRKCNIVERTSGNGSASVTLWNVRVVTEA